MYESHNEKKARLEREFQRTKDDYIEFKLGLKLSSMTIERPGTIIKEKRVTTFENVEYNDFLQYMELQRMMDNAQHELMCYRLENGL